MKKLIVRVIIAVLVIGLVILFARKQVQGDKYRNVKSVDIEDNSSYKYSYDIKVNSKEKRFCYTEYDKCDKTVKTIKTESKNIEVLDNYKDEYLFFRDNNKLKMYSSDNEKTYQLNLEDKYSNYSFVVVNSKFLGIIYEDNKLDGFYSVDLNKHMYTKKYNNINVVSEKYLSGSIYDDNNIDEGKQVKEELLSVSEEKILLSKEVKTTSEFNSYFFKEVNGYIVLVSSNENDQIYKEIYSSDLKEVYKTSRDESYTVDAESFTFVYGSDIGNDKNIYVYEDGYFSKYDQNGKLVKKTNKLEDVVLQIKEYVVTQNENISLLDINSKATVVTKYDSNMLLRSELTTYDESEKAIVFVMEEDNITAEELYKECKSIKTCNYKEEEFKNALLGHKYYYYLSSSKVVKVPTIIPYENNPAL